MYSSDINMIGLETLHIMYMTIAEPICGGKVRMWVEGEGGVTCGRCEVRM